MTGAVTLVNKDQLDILASLRESVNEDKAGMEADLERMKTQLKDLQDKSKMQLEQINGLLLEKVSLQGDGIDQRERMLARERDFGQVFDVFLSQFVHFSQEPEAHDSWQRPSGRCESPVDLTSRGGRSVKGPVQRQPRKVAQSESGPHFYSVSDHLLNPQ
jgi:hypothetical protein